MLTVSSGSWVWLKNTVINREVLVKPVATGTGGRGQVVESTSLALLFKTPFDIITCG